MSAPTCSACGMVIDGATAILERGRPSPGDIAVCMYCGHVMAFDIDAVSLRELSDTEAHMVAGDPRLLAVQRARKQVRKLWEK